MNINFARSVRRSDWPLADIGKQGEFTVLKAWLMNINKIDRRYRKASKRRQRCLLNSHKLNLGNSRISRIHNLFSLN